MRWLGKNRFLVFLGPCLSTDEDFFHFDSSRLKISHPAFNRTQGRFFVLRALFFVSGAFAEGQLAQSFCAGKSVKNKEPSTKNIEHKSKRRISYV